MKAAAQLHDQVNLVLLPLLGVAAIAGLLHVIDPYYVTVFLTTYILADLIWIWLQPTCLPSLPNVIMAHHVVTLVLLSFPLRFPEFGVYTCLDGLAEVNTYFLIARRQYKQWAGVCDVLYWVTFVPFRIVLYPGLLVPFACSLASYSLLNKVLCLGAQGLLCLFNVALLQLSVKGLLKRRQPKKQQDDVLQNAKGGGQREGPVGMVADATAPRCADAAECSWDAVEHSDGSSRSSVDVVLTRSAVGGGSVPQRRSGHPHIQDGGSANAYPSSGAYVETPVVQPRLVAAS